MKSLRILLFFISIAFISNIDAQTVYTTKTGEKYHKGSCKYLKYSKKEITLKKAKSLGYTSCSVCKPTAKNTKASNIVKVSSTYLPQNHHYQTHKIKKPLQPDAQEKPNLEHVANVKLKVLTESVISID